MTKFQPPAIEITAIETIHGEDRYGLRVRFRWLTLFNTSAYEKLIEKDRAVHREANRKRWQDGANWEFRREPWPTVLKVNSYICDSILASPAWSDWHAKNPTVQKLATMPFKVKPPKPETADQFTSCVWRWQDGGTVEVIVQTVDPFARPATQLKLLVPEAG